MTKEYTTEEDQYLIDIVENRALKALKMEEIAYLLNSKFNCSRTVSSIKDRINFLERKETVAVETKKKMKKGWKIEDTPNSRKGWVTADDKYLLENWTADVDTRQEVANYLGRSVASCSTRTSVLKHKHKEYYLTLIAGGLHTNSTIGTMAIGNDEDNSQITIATEAKVVTTKLSHLLVGVSPDEYSLLDKIYHRIKTRQARKQMVKHDREQEKMKRKSLQDEISSLQKELKAVGR